MYDSGNGTTGFGMRGRGGAARPFLPTCARQNSPQFPVFGVRLRRAWQFFRGKPQARLLSLLLVLIAVGGSEALANTLPPEAVVNVYPERAPLNASNQGRMVTGEDVTFDGRSSYTTRSGTVITTYRWFVNGSQTQSGTSPVFTFTAGAAGTNVTIGLEVRDSYGTWSTRRNVIMEVAPIPRRYYYITDHLGSVRAVTNELGELVAYSDFYPFGLEMPKRSLAGDDATKEGYTGHELYAETGLNYAGARYYDPEIGRWLAVDPLWMKYPSLSSYNYVANNPLVFVDPDGRDFIIYTDRDDDGNVVGYRIVATYYVQTGDKRSFNAMSTVASRVNGITGSVEAEDGSIIDVSFDLNVEYSDIAYGMAQTEGGNYVEVMDGTSFNKRYSDLGGQNVPSTVGGFAYPKQVSYAAFVPATRSPEPGMQKRLQHEVGHTLGLPDGASPIMATMAGKQYGVLVLPWFGEKDANAIGAMVHNQVLANPGAHRIVVSRKQQ
jgi:RHS repeat-associated protein